MRGPMMPASLKNIQEAQQIPFNISMRVLNGITQACLCGEIHHIIKFKICKYFLDTGTIVQIPLYKSKVLISSQKLKPRFLQIDIIIVIEVIQPNDPILLSQKFL